MFADTPTEQVAFRTLPKLLQQNTQLQKKKKKNTDNNLYVQITLKITMRQSVWMDDYVVGDLNYQIHFHIFG